MALYFANTEITGIKDLFPLSSKDITGLYFGDTELFTIWAEYDGTLPATFNANGSMLADYRIYGAAGGAGDKTVNNFNTEIEQGNLYAGEIQPPTSENFYKRCRTKDYVNVPSGNTITVKSQYDLWVYCYSGTKYISQYGSTDWSKQYTFTVPSGINNIKIMFANDDKTSNLFISDFANDVMLVSGSTAPAEYIPYGYEVDMSISDGTASTTTPIYIGDDQLDAIGNYADYVDYHAGKIVRIVRSYAFTGNESVWRSMSNSVELLIPNLGINIVANSSVRSYSPDNDVLFQNMTYPAIRISVSGISAGADVMPYLKSLYDNGTPAVMWYVSSAPVEVDPPVPLPALPTVDGGNVVGYAGQSTALSKFYAKYRKEGFN